MTFIVAIQLNDSIIVTADNKKVILKETGEIEFSTKQIPKIYTWNEGIITGTGESYVISRSIGLFKELPHPRIDELPQCLDISRKTRELEIGTDYYQVENTKLLCSSYNEQGAQLYTIQRFDSSQPYELTAINPMGIIVWLFHPSIETISVELQNLYAELKDCSAFFDLTDWVNYYINRLALIYQKQSQQDPFMSQSFDFFFQTKNECITGHIPNTHTGPLKFQETSIDFDSI